MKMLRITFPLCLLLAVQGMFCSFPAKAEVDWHMAKQLMLESEPLDVAVSPDAKSLFVLVRGKVLVYSSLGDSIKGTIPVDEATDRVRVSPKGDYLILWSSSNKILRFIQFSLIEEIDLSGLPYKGLKEAPVTIAVFSDYQ